MRVPVDKCYHFTATTTSAALPITGGNVQTTRYQVVNGGAQEVFLVMSRNAAVTAAFPANGTAAKGYMIPANGEVIVDGPICGQGNTAYAAAVASTGSTDLYITPVSRE